MAKRSRRIEVKVGNVAVPIYSLGSGKFAIVYRESSGGKRKKHQHNSLAVARRRAEEIAIRIANGSDAAADVAQQVVHAITRSHRPNELSRSTIPDLVEALLTSKSVHKLSARYMRGLRGDLRAFAKRFPVYVDELRALPIERYLRELAVSDRRRNNVRDEIVTLFLFAKKHGNLPEDKITEAEKVDRIQLEHGPPRIYTPAQLDVIIEHVSPEWLDWICLQAFAGIRPEECGLPHISKKDGRELSLSWDLHFLWDDKQIHIPALISKTGRDRYVTISDTLLAWVGHHRGARGPVFPNERPDRETTRLGKVLPFDWINDGLRHSFASYWNSLHRNMAQLKEEMGNSEQVNRRYYFNPQPESRARAWLEKRPSSLDGNKVIQMPLAISFG